MEASSRASRWGTWGSTAAAPPPPPTPDVCVAVAKTLGGVVHAWAMEVRVRGYGAPLGQLPDNFAKLRAELRVVFPEVPVKIRSYVLLWGTGLQGTIYTLVLEGVPDGWHKYVVHSADNCISHKEWTLLQRAPERPAY